MQLRTPAGVVAIEGDRATWAAPLEYQAVPRDAREHTITHASVHPGDNALVLGRVSIDGGTPTIHATGHESLLLFAAPDDARKTLRRLMLGWLLNAGLLLATIAGSIGLALYMWSHARPS